MKRLNLDNLPFDEETSDEKIPRKKKLPVKENNRNKKHLKSKDYEQD